MGDFPIPQTAERSGIPALFHGAEVAGCIAAESACWQTTILMQGKGFHPPARGYLSGSSSKGCGSSPGTQG
eukprot:1137313-Pelagomonas_calceolata.AAC.3